MVCLKRSRIERAAAAKVFWSGRSQAIRLPSEPQSLEPTKSSSSVQTVAPGDAGRDQSVALRRSAEGLKAISSDARASMARAIEQGTLRLAVVTATARQAVELPHLERIGPLLARLREHYRPLEIWLFGSRARGDASDGSDWDLAAVVADDSRAELFDPIVAWQLLRYDSVGADVVIFPRGEFEEDRGTPNTIPYAVAREGIRLE